MACLLGSDALGLCFNGEISDTTGAAQYSTQAFICCVSDVFWAAVAMVFLLEVDNLVYLFLVSEAMKKHMEEVRIAHITHDF